MTVQTKVLLTVILLMLIVFGISTTFHVRSVRHDSVMAIRQFSDVLAHTLANDITETFQQLPNTQSLLEGFSIRCAILFETYAHKSVTHVAVINAADHVAAHSRSELVGHPVTNPALLAQLNRRQSGIILDNSVYHTLVPVFGSLDDVYLGTVDIGVSQQIVDAKVHHAITQGVQIYALCIAGMSVLLWLWLRQRVTKPLRNLLGIGEKIAQGEVGEQGTMQTIRQSSPPDKQHTRDEIQKLRRIFAEIDEYVGNMAITAKELACGNVRQHVLPRSDADMLGQALLQMSAYLYDMTTAAAAIAEGSLHQNIDAKSSRDELGLTFARMLDYLRNIAELTAHIANGNVDVAVAPESGDDVLYAASRQMVAYLQEAARVAENIANDNLEVMVQPRSQHDRLNTAFQRMVKDLRASKTRLEATMAQTQEQSWFRAGQTELNDVMRGEQDVKTLAGHIITYLTKYLQAQVGALYVMHEEDGEIIYRIGGAYALMDRNGPQAAFRSGEGLVGQAAVSKKSLLISDIPEGHLSITVGLGASAPRQILAVPCLYEQQVLGVVEVGTAQEFSEAHQEFLKRVQENIAIALHTAQSRLRMQQLLSHASRQSEELQQQQEELRQTNANLQQQAEAVQASEERLRVQQEELRQTNEELESHTKALTSQKAELNEKNAELERARQGLEEKTRALENSQHLLETRMWQLERAEQYKSEFLANMSHELRTPLNSLLMLAKLLYENKEGNLTSKQQEFARTIHAAGSDLLNLINEVLDLSKVETGKMILNIEQTNLNNLSTYISQNFRHMAEAKKLYLRIEVEKNLPASMTTDRQRVEQIVKNLVANALKFTKEGGVRVQLSRPAQSINLAGTSITPDRGIAIAVSDTGIGIPESKQQTIFEAFQQADTSISGQYGGTGLGLSISREFAKLLGGKIHLDSEEGQGSTFTLLLPEHFEQAPSDEQQAMQPEILEPQAPLRHREEVAPMISSESIETIRDDRHDITPDDKTLLIVEDDPQFTKKVFDLARERGFKGLVAGDGEAGLQLAFQYNPSAILLNITLPRMNGWVVTEKLRRNPETRHIPIHFTSGEGGTHASMPTGSVGYMTRPVADDDLEDAMLLIESTMTFSLKKVLVIADNQATRERLLESLRGNDLEISTATTAQEAYNQVKQEAFDGIVLDLRLRDMTGFDLIDLLHRDPLVSYLPIITYSAEALSLEEQQRLQALLQRTLESSSSVQERVFDEIILFLHQVEAELPEARQKKVRMLHGRETVFRGKTILLVDDDMRNLYALTSTLEDHQMNVLMAVNGKEALTMLNDHAYEIHLVMMDGYEAIRTIRKQSNFSRLPIIALTARAMRGDRQKCIEAGANDYLSKPVDIDKLLSLLRVWLY